MAANSVSGSFRGIEVSFSYNGPHIVMSVLNTKEVGRQLRVMYQHQPPSGRVNWTSLQLTGQKQNVVVPPEVINAHKLAFYVDDHEPIATYMESILNELQHLQVPENEIPETTSDELENNTEENTTESNEEIGVQDKDNSTKDSQIENSQTDELQSANKVEDKISKQDIIKETANGYDSDNKLDNSKFKLEDSTPIQPQSTNTKPKDTKSQQNGQKDTIPNQIPNEQSIPKRKTQYVGRYVPDVSTELQFNIKVPTIPKSASKQEVTFIPPRPALTPKSNSKKFGIFGQLAGAIGLNVPKKKMYYMQENRHLYEKFHANLEKMERDYNDGCGIPLDNWDLESLSEQQTAVLLLNLMVNELEAWKKEAKKASTTEDTLAKSLEKIEKELKQTLKQTRGIDAPAPTLFPDRTAASDQDLMRIQKNCDVYLERFSEKLAALEQKHAEKVRVSAFKKFLLEFIRDKLFPKVAEFSSLKFVQKRLNWFLNLVDYELIPIEPGKTKFSPELHKVKGKRRTDLESNTIVEVVSPGLQTKDGKRIIQNAVVIQAE